MTEAIELDTARALLDAPSGQRPRVYARLDDGQIVKLASHYYLEKYRGLILVCWTVGDDVTIMDYSAKA